MKATTRTLATVTKVAVSLRAGTRGWGRRQGQGREEPCGAGGTTEVRAGVSWRTGRRRAVGE